MHAKRHIGTRDESQPPILKLVTIDERVKIFAEPLERYVKVRNYSSQSIRNIRNAVGHFERMGYTKLDTDSLAGYRAQREAEGASLDTIRGELGKLLSFARWLGEKPELVRPYGIKRAPKAWSREELTQLYMAARRTKGTIYKIPGSLWWPAMIALVYDSGERISAVLSIRWCDIDWQGKTVLCSAENRKFRRADMVHPLHETTIEALQALRAFLREPAESRIFGGRGNQTTIYAALEKLLKEAGLSAGRRDKFHKLRRTLATEVHLAGGDATARLGHASDAITRESYIDPRAYQQVEPWRPGQPDPEAGPQGVKAWLGKWFRKAK